MNREKNKCHVVPPMWGAKCLPLLVSKKMLFFSRRKKLKNSNPSKTVSHRQFKRVLRRVSPQSPLFPLGNIASVIGPQQPSQAH